MELHRLGRVYRSYRWPQIIQAGVARHAKGPTADLVLTPEDCPEFLGGHGYWYVSQNCRKLIILHATEENREALMAYRGGMDYDETERRR